MSMSDNVPALWSLCSTGQMQCMTNNKICILDSESYNEEYKTDMVSVWKETILDRLNSEGLWDLKDKEPGIQMQQYRGKRNHLEEKQTVSINIPK